MKFCEQCGAEVAKDAVFCHVCGAAVAREEDMEHTGEPASMDGAEPKANVLDTNDSADNEAAMTKNSTDSETATPDSSADMSMIFCHNCGTKVPAEFDFCPECGASIALNQDGTVTPADKPQRGQRAGSKLLVRGAALLVALCLIGICIFMLRGKKAFYVRTEEDCKSDCIVYEESGCVYLAVKGESTLLTTDADNFDGAALVTCDNRKMILYVIADDYTGTLYSLFLDDLGAMPQWIASDVSACFNLGNDCIALEIGEDGNQKLIYNLALSQTVPKAGAANREDNELYTESYGDDLERLFLHRDGKDVLIESDLWGFETAAADKGLVYFLNGREELYRYSAKKEKAEKLADDVEWMSDAFSSGELYYMTDDGFRESLVYYDGKHSVELPIEQGSDFTLCWRRDADHEYVSVSDQKKKADKGKAYCVVKYRKSAGDTAWLLVLEDSLEELQGTDIGQVYVDEACSEIFYTCNEGIMYGTIKGKKLQEVVLYMGRPADCTEILQYGTVDGGAWCLSQAADGTVSLYAGGVNVAEGINTSAFMEKNGILYYGLSNSEETLDNSFYAYSHGEVTKLFDYNVFLKRDMNTAFYANNYNEDTETADLYYFNPDGADVLLDSYVEDAAEVDALRVYDDYEE